MTNYAIKEKQTNLSCFVSFTIVRKNKKVLEEFKKKLLNLRSDYYSMFLFNFNNDKNLNVLYSIESVISVEFLVLELRIMLSRYIHLFKMHVTYPNLLASNSDKNLLSVVVGSKYDYFSKEEFPDIFEETKNALYGVNKFVVLEKLLISNSNIMIFDYTIDTVIDSNTAYTEALISSDAVVEIIKTIVSFIVNKKFNRVNNLWGSGYAVSNYRVFSEETINILQKCKDAKEYEYEIENLCDDNDIIIKQLSIFK